MSVAISCKARQALLFTGAVIGLRDTLIKRTTAFAPFKMVIALQQLNLPLSCILSSFRIATIPPAVIKR
jgi:hypothetical protein